MAAAGMAGEPVLLDVTRLVARSWTGRHATGIDRVCSAYLHHFRARARAVVQHRGVIRVLGAGPSADLFDLLDTSGRGTRGGIVRLLSAALIGGAAQRELVGLAYLNIGHTDFDLPAHGDWVRQAGLRPFYFLHDLIPVLHPEFSRPHAVRRHLGRVLCALNSAAGIILGTAAVRRELEDFAAARGLTLPPVAVAHLAGTDFRAPPPPAPPIDQPFFLCVGTIEPRKNHRLLLTLWQRLAARLGERTPRLVIAGQTGPMTGDLLAPLAAVPGLGAHVAHRPACPDSELAGLMRHARAVLVPSLAEGFGLTFVEALEIGTPVIASDLPVFREIGQGAARLIDPADVDGWEEAVLAAIAARPALAGAFVPPSWHEHFLAVERFVAAPAEYARTMSERVLAA